MSARGWAREKRPPRLPSQVARDAEDAFHDFLEAYRSGGFHVVAEVERGEFYLEAKLTVSLRPASPGPSS